MASIWLAEAQRWSPSIPFFVKPALLSWGLLVMHSC